MALLVAATNNFIELSLDAVTNLDLCNDLVALGLNRNAPNGMIIKKITFVPSAEDDTLVVRDGAGGPRVFSAITVLGTYDVLKDEYTEPDGKGKLMSPYIDAAECTIALANNAFIIFEL